jgi:hypothetical protein
VFVLLLTSSGSLIYRYAEAEKTNGRWAMAGVAGIMGQELLGVTPKWYEAGAKEYSIDFLPLLALEFIFMGFFETKRYQGYKNTGSVRPALPIERMHNTAGTLCCPSRAATACCFKTRLFT